MAIDPHWNNVSLLLHADEAGAPYMDKSSLNHTITNNNVVTSNVIKKFGDRSFEFSSASTYLSVPNDAGVFFGTGAFTIEFWFNPSVAGTNVPIISTWTAGNSDAWIVHYNVGNTGKVSFYAGANSTVTPVVEGATALTIDSWHHIAITRDDLNNTRLFVDGVLEGEALGTSYNNTNLNGNLLTIGRQVFVPANFVDGNIDEIRITKGVARYTANFTPSTAAFPEGGDTYWNNVVLLTHFDDPADRKLDSSDLGLSATVSGTVTYPASNLSNGIQVGASSHILYGDPNGDLEFGVGDFTVEGWLKQNASTGINSLISTKNYTTTSGTWTVHAQSGRLGFASTYGNNLYTQVGNIPASALTNGVWTHWAVARESGTIRMYINGEFIASGTDNTDLNDPGGLYIGHQDANPTGSFNGIQDEIRLTKGVARYTSETVDYVISAINFPDNGGSSNPNEIPSELSTEDVQDIIGGMVYGNTETGIAVTYDDAAGKLDFSISSVAWVDVTGKPANFAPSSHTHSWSDITGVPDATIGAKGVVQLSSSTASNSTTEAATPSAVKTAFDLANGKANASHTHAASDIVSGTFSDARYAATSNAKGTRTVSTSGPSGGSNGDIWMEV